MPTKKALQSSVLSLQNDMPYLLGRKAVSTASVAVSSTRPVAAAAAAATVDSLDKIAITALKAKARSSEKSTSSTKATAATPQTSASTAETFSTWRVTQPQHWSDGLIRPPTQDARSVLSPHWSRLPPRGVVGSGQQQQVFGK